MKKNYRVVCGDALETLKNIPSNIINCCVTSPPYWGLRDYGVEGQLGLEKTPEEYVGKVVKIFREVRRVLRKEGVMFLNLGDSYATRNVPIYGTCDTIPQDCPLHGSFWNHPCDGCQAVSVLRSFGKDRFASPKLSDDSLVPTLEHKEFGNGHSPTSRSFPQKQIHQSSCAIQGRDDSQGHVDEPLLSFQESMPDEFFPRFQDDYSRKDNPSSFQDEAGEKIHDEMLSSGKMVCIADTSQTSFSSDGRMNINHNVYPCRYSTKKNQISQELKPKDLVGIPWLVAFALRADGWYLRQDIIWYKTNPLPESVKDRCTKAHEYIFLLSKSKKYYYDAEAIAEPITDSTAIRLLQDIENQRGSNRVPTKTNGPMKAVINKKFTKEMGGGGTTFVGHKGYKKADGTLIVKPTRNKRSVWTVTTKPFKGAHFATFPQDLILPCVLAGCPENGIILDPFSGAGTTGLVALKNNRRVYMIELNSKYIQITKERFKKEGF